ncbi:MAG TPA: indolepyruvate oxidoreductase subunit beta [Clostridiaceae bacterium]|nr:indolepyruvate oxidoreductase subunit beta [Clostridiaceae bacterium]
MTNLSIMIVGVGGQGSLLASKMIGTVAMKKNFDVKVSEVHGMSQRGGSVVTYVRLGEKINSPLIEQNSADIIMAFEKLEALRWIKYLKEDGKLIINDQRIDPMPVITGKEKYPEGIIEFLKSKYKDNVISIDALKVAKELGNLRVVNMVLIGILASKTSIEKEVWLEALREVLPAKLQSVNEKAFEIGYNFAVK